MIKKLSIASISILVSLSIAVIALNFIYLSGIIDFYKPELTAFNSERDLSKDASKDTMLIMGDSFSVGNYTYPNILRNIIPHYRIINSSVSGTGIIQTTIMAKKRIMQFKPNVFIYQIYLGNDLFDITYPVNWRNISVTRNIYWFISNRLRVVSYINYRLGQIKALRNENYTEYIPSPSLYINSDEFSADKYTKRELIYYMADNSLIEDTVLVKGKRKKDFTQLIDTLNEVFNLLPVDCKKIIVVVPHMAQLHELYLNRSVQLGGVFSEPDRILDIEYPFIKQVSEQLPEVAVLNALPPLRNAEAKGTTVYFSNDGHLNINGQKILADYIASHLND